MSHPTPIFAGRVNRGKFVADDPGAVRRWLAQHGGRRMELVIRPVKSQRSLRQNALLWRANEILADALGYDRHEVEAVHYAMLAARFGEDGPLKLPARTSSQLSVEEFSDYMDWYVRYAAEQFGVVIPLPGEVE